MNETYAKLGMKPADILLPRDADMSKWAVVACDQFTSQPEYWEEADRIVGDAPSTLRLILPESKLNDPNVEEHIADINRSMEDYLARTSSRPARTPSSTSSAPSPTARSATAWWPLWTWSSTTTTPGSGSLIRATEGTVLERIPPRVRVRKDAPIELPHVMLLIDDPDKTCIEPITAAVDAMEQVLRLYVYLFGAAT